MDIIIRGSKLEITEAMESYAKEKISRLEKYLENSDDTHATILVKIHGHLHIVEVTIPLKNFILRAEESKDDFYAAIDTVTDKLERQIRKNKTKLKKQNKVNNKYEYLNFDYEVKDNEEENNKIVKQGETGELKISSDNLFVEYLNNPSETNRIKEIDENGKEWVSSGDLCYIDNDGFIFTKGRNRRIIKKEAFKISPDTIEEVIMNIPFVKECVVVGVNDKKSISVPMAFVVLNEEIKDYDEAKKIVFEKCKQELPDYEVPSYVEIIEKIPYTQNNKYDFVKLENIGNHIVEKSIKKVCGFRNYL